MMFEIAVFPLDRDFSFLINFSQIFSKTDQSAGYSVFYNF